MSEHKYKLAYRFTTTKSDEQYAGWGGRFAHAYIEVMLGEELDAAKEYDSHPDAYHLERLQKIRMAGKSAKYFSKCDYEGFTLRWQADSEGWERYEAGSRWYGCHVEDSKIEKATAKLLAKVSTRLSGGFYTTPQAALAVLRGMGARPVKYGDCYLSWIYLDVEPNEELAVLEISPFAKPEPVIAGSGLELVEDLILEPVSEPVNV